MKPNCVCPDEIGVETLLYVLFAIVHFRIYFAKYSFHYHTQFKTFIFALMITVNYPEPSFRMKEENGKNFIFDLIRRQWIVLTEEEWVRQNFINYMVRVLKYPATLIAVEKEIYLGELKKRFDILVYDYNHQPWLLTECKAPGIRLEQPVLEQVLRYGISVPAKFLLVTNGNATFGWQKRDNTLEMIKDLPAWEFE